MVVTVVIRTGRKRCAPVSSTSRWYSSFERGRFSRSSVAKVSTSTMLLFTTTPASDTTPMKVKTPKPELVRIRPNITPGIDMATAVRINSAR